VARPSFALACAENDHEAHGRTAMDPGIGRDVRMLRGQPLCTTVRATLTVFDVEARVV
jgi:hypothetical protein